MNCGISVDPKPFNQLCMLETHFKPSPIYQGYTATPLITVWLECSRLTHGVMYSWFI